MCIYSMRGEVEKLPTADEEIQQIPPPGYECQGNECSEFAPPDAFVEEVLDEE